MKLQKKITLLTVIIMIFTLGTATYFSVIKMKNIIKDQMSRNAMDIAYTVASMKNVQDNIGEPKGSVQIQRIIENIRLKTRVQFITVMDMNGTRYSHPIPENVGEKFAGGDELRVLQNGNAYITEGVGTLGRSLRAFVPIYKDGEQIGAVCVGILTGWIAQEFKQLLYEFIPYIVIAIIVGIVGAALLSQNIKKTILGLEPEEIAWMVGEREAIFQSMKEGIIAVNRLGNITLINRTAKDILGLTEGVVGENIDELKFKGKFLEVLKSGKAIHNIEEKPKSNITVLSDYSPLVDNKGNILGVLVSFQDLTKVKQMAEELTGIKKMTWSLRAQNHEFMNKLHTISGLIQLEEYDRALEYINETTIDRNQIMGVLNHNIKDMPLAALLLAKYNRASELRIDFKINESSRLDKLPEGLTSDELCTIVGNLIENSIDAVVGKVTAFINIKILESDNNLNIEVTNNGEPIPESVGEKIYEKGISTKKSEGERGYGLYNVKEILSILGGKINYNTGEETSFKVSIPMSEVEDK